MFKAQGCRVLEASVAGARTRGRNDAASWTWSRVIARVVSRVHANARSPVYGLCRGPHLTRTHLTRPCTARAEGSHIFARGRLTPRASQSCRGPGWLARLADGVRNFSRVTIHRLELMAAVRSLNRWGKRTAAGHTDG